MSDLDQLAAAAVTHVADYRNARLPSPAGMAELWEAVAALANECAHLSDRIAVQENRRVGRPPKVREEAGQD